MIFTSGVSFFAVFGLSLIVRCFPPHGSCALQLTTKAAVALRCTPELVPATKMVYVLDGVVTVACALSVLLTAPLVIVTELGHPLKLAPAGEMLQVVMVIVPVNPLMGITVRL